jgi:hypothetical protein
VYLYDTNSRSDSSNFFENLKEPEPTINPQCRGRLHRRVHYISAICGGGKTYVAIQAAISRARRNKKSVIVSETMNQSKERQKELADSGVRVHRVDSETDPKHVTQRIRELLKSRGGLILLITHAAIYSLLGNFKGKSETAVFFDELPGFFKLSTINVPDTHSFLTQHLQFDGDSYDGIYQKVLVSDLEAMKQIAINEREDDLLKLLQEMAWGLWSEAWDVFVNLEQYRKLENGEADRLTFFFRLNPAVFEGWERFSILAADFEDSDFFEHYQDHLDFVKDPLRKTLRATSHTNGHLLEVVSSFEGSASKKSLGQDSHLKEWIGAVKQDALGRKLFYHAHKSEGDLFDAEQAERAESKIKGFNKYQHHDCVVIASAPNPSPEAYKFLKIVMGLDTNDVHRRLQRDHAYQTISRLPIRDPASTIPVTAYVLTHELADAMAEKFAGCTRKKLRLNGSSVLGKERNLGSKSGSERWKEWKARVKTAKAEALSEQLNLIDRDSANEKVKEGLYTQTFAESDRFNFNRSFSYEHPAQIAFGSKLAKTNSWTADGYFIASSNDDFIAQLETLHPRILKSKTESALISPAVFDEDGRKEENIRYCRGIWLDFENGDLTPKEFSKKFPDLWMVIFNSYRHTCQKPRFRVLILTTDRLTPAVYKRIWDRIALKLEMGGHQVYLKKGRPSADKKKSGLDNKSRCPTQLYYLPAQCEYCDGMDSFFWNLKEGREALDPVQWIENDHYIPPAPTEATEPQGQASDAPPNLIAIDRAKADYRLTQAGDFNYQIGRLAGRFEAANMLIWQIESELMAEAKLHHGEHPKDLYRDIPKLAEKMRQRRLSRA